MTQVVTPQADPKTTHSETTYFLCMDDPTEQRIAAAWLRAVYPNTKGRLTNTLPLRRLSERAVIIPVIRGEDRTPIDERRRTADGKHEYEHHRYADLIGEVRECKPVKTGEYWKAKTDEWDAFGGTLLEGPFISELAVSATPMIPKTHVGSPDILKLSWI